MKKKRISLEITPEDNIIGSEMVRKFGRLSPEDYYKRFDI